LTLSSGTSQTGNGLTATSGAQVIANTVHSNGFGSAFVAQDAGVMYMWNCGASGTGNALLAQFAGRIIVESSSSFTGVGGGWIALNPYMAGVISLRAGVTVTITTFGTGI